MKKMSTLILLMLIIFSAKSQPWFDVGLKGGLGTSFMYNKQIFDDQYLTHKFKPGYTYGAKLGYNFIQQHQITFDVMQSSLTQGFIYYPEAGNEVFRDYTINATDLLLMYRSNLKGTYFEVGPQWSNVSKVKYKDEGGDFLAPYTPDEIVNKSYFSLAVGFGGYIFGTDNFGITAGFRINYTLNDIASEAGRDKNFPMLTPGDPDPTHNLGVIFMLEANYDFGYLVSSRCGKRNKLFVF